mmetsp:Transcript_15678/g.22731  ORF Transcript_15678/g.22731 Transcript_15678/m.22731 type:complete len:460 (-) Transcript_15678:158-1537(-)
MKKLRIIFLAACVYAVCFVLLSPRDLFLAPKLVWEDSSDLPPEETTTTNKNNSFDQFKITYVYRMPTVDGCPVEEKEPCRFEGSQRLIVTNESDKPDSIWVVYKFKENDIDFLTHEVQQSYDRRIAAAAAGGHGKTNHDKLGQWKIFFYDPSDIMGLAYMENIGKIISNITGWRRVYLITRTTTNPMRSMQNYRYPPWDKPFDRRHLGWPYNFTAFIGTAYAGIKHYHFHVRNDLLVALRSQLSIMFNSTELPNPAEINRPLDCVTFWASKMSTRNAGMRFTAVGAVKSLPSKFPGRNISVMADIVGNRAKKGRNSVHEDYAQALLTYKIVVVVQRDVFEDHWRLFEALVSGALVLTDPMYDFPAGLEDKKTLVIFQSFDDLVEKVIYYLDHPEERIAIARAGREVSLKYHLPHHRWEDLLLGDYETRNEFGLSTRHSVAGTDGLFLGRPKNESGLFSL